jgi:hypothetical protein
MLKDRILTIMTALPSVTAGELRQLLPDADRRKIKTTIDALLRDREIERLGYGRYAVNRRPTVDAERTVRGQRLQRLMGGK